MGIEGESDFDAQIPNHLETHTIHKAQSPSSRWKQRSRACSMNVGGDKFHFKNGDHIFLKSSDCLQTQATL